MVNVICSLLIKAVNIGKYQLMLQNPQLYCIVEWNENDEELQMIFPFLCSFAVLKQYKSNPTH